MLGIYCFLQSKKQDKTIYKLQNLSVKKKFFRFYRVKLTVFLLDKISVQVFAKHKPGFSKENKFKKLESLKFLHIF